MNFYLEPQGFLGTGASLLADITLIAYILLIVPGMIIGSAFAVFGKHRPHHKWAMVVVTIANWLLISFLMLAAFTFDVTGNIGQQPGNPRYLVPVIHGVLGLLAQILATYTLFRMFREDAQVAAAKKRGERDVAKYWFKSAKPVMRLVLVLWLVTALLGVGNYVIRYGVIPPLGGGNTPAAPVATPDVTELPPKPAATAEVLEPVATENVSPPAETIAPPAPAETIEPPVATEEASS
ncbi:MAG: hypothetical protein H6672_01330 [Anaerolineaceae bacterium]|nr:hypothetical protein [Anaerolineaceae bacterium]